jgi:hypothetical protein
LNGKLYSHNFISISNWIRTLSTAIQNEREKMRFYPKSKLSALFSFSLSAKVQTKPKLMCPSVFPFLGRIIFFNLFIQQIVFERLRAKPLFLLVS